VRDASPCLCNGGARLRRAKLARGKDGLRTIFALVIPVHGLHRWPLMGVGARKAMGAPYHLPLITLAAILGIGWLAASLGNRKIRSLEPAVIFRG
jgi:hypothetical protein